MPEIITTLHKKGDSTIDVYPNIKASNIPNNAITSSKINTGAVTNPKIADSSIGESKIIDGSVTSAKIYTGAVTTDKINNGAVTTSKLDDASVTTTKINDSAVTTAKINNGAVTSDKINNLTKLTGVVLVNNGTALEVDDIETLHINFIIPLIDADNFTILDFKGTPLYRNLFTNGYLKIKSTSKYYFINRLLITNTTFVIKYIDENNAEQSITLTTYDDTTLTISYHTPFNIIG